VAKDLAAVIVALVPDLNEQADALIEVVSGAFEKIRLETARPIC